MVISSKDFDWVPGSMVIAKGPKKVGPLHERNAAPYDGVARRVKEVISVELDSSSKTFDPLVVIYGVEGAHSLSDFDIVK